MTKIEILLELTQEEAGKVAFVLEQVVAHWGLTEEEKQLFSDVAVSLRNATRDAQQRASDDDHHAWVNRRN